MKSHNSMKRCLTKTKDYVARVGELQYGYMTINPLPGPENNIAVLTAQIQELHTRIEALKKADEQKDAKTDELLQLTKQHAANGAVLRHTVIEHARQLLVIGAKVDGLEHHLVGTGGW